MVSSIIARKYKDGERVNLSLRLATPELKNAVALNISVDTDRWNGINKSLKTFAKSYRSGADIVTDDSLKLKLWNLIKTIETIYESGRLTLAMAKDTVHTILRPDLLEDMERIEEEAQAKEEAGNRVTLIQWIKDYIDECESGERLKQKSARTITHGTIKTYKGTLAQLEAYAKKRHKVIDFDDITMDFYDDWRKFFLEKKDAKGNPRPYSPNTIGKHIKNLKIFLYAAKDMKLTTRDDFESARFSADSKDVENVYLTDERVQQMYETDFEDARTIDRLMKLAPNDEERSIMKDQLTRRTPKLLNEAKDIFTVGCLTGQRVSDYKRINEEMFRTLSDGKEYIYLQQTKTQKWIYIPLDVRVRAILAKYGGKLPNIYDQDLNERVKVIGRLLGWRENGGIMELHGTMEVPTQKKFYELIKTHTARRTFATNAYKRKISLSSIMVITGHSTEAMLRKYLKLDNVEKAMMAAAEFEKAKEVQLKIAE
jgi:hypothetical protein